MWVGGVGAGERGERGVVVGEVVVGVVVVVVGRGEDCGGVVGVLVVGLVVWGVLLVLVVLVMWLGRWLLVGIVLWGRQFRVALLVLDLVEVVPDHLGIALVGVVGGGDQAVVVDPRRGLLVSSPHAVEVFHLGGYMCCGGRVQGRVSGPGFSYRDGSPRR